MRGRQPIRPVQKQKRMVVEDFNIPKKLGYCTDQATAGLWVHLHQHWRQLSIDPAWCVDLALGICIGALGGGQDLDDIMTALII